MLDEPQDAVDVAEPPVRAVAVVSDFRTVKGERAEALAAEIAAGAPKGALLAAEPPDVRRLVAETIKRSGLDPDVARKLRKARTVELIVDPDPDVAAKGIALSQREDGVGAGPVVQFNHWAGGPPSGSEALEAEFEDAQ